MSASSSMGESSSKQQENGDVLPGTGTDRPLKKARFAWQVKGKHHLKTERVNDIAPMVKQTETEKFTSSSDNESSCNESLGRAEQNLEILGDYLLKTDFNTMDTVINTTKVTSPVPDLPKIYNSSNRTYPPGAINASTLYYDDVLNPFVADPVHEDEQISRWQARQMAKGFVDNTINRVLESWMETPMPAEIDNGLVALDVADFINNLPGDNSVENEGILMAISAHGLQSASSGNANLDNSLASSSKETTVAKSSALSCDHSSNIQEISNGNAKETEFQDKINSFDKIKIDIEANSLEKTNNTLEKVNLTEPKDEFCSSNKEKSSLKKMRKTKLNKRKNISNALYDELLYEDNEDLLVTFAQQESLRIAHLPIIYDENEEEDLSAHFNFMEAAVSFAIQNNGLSSFGTNS